MRENKKFKIVDSKEDIYVLTIKFHKNEYNEFFESLNGYKVLQFQEKPFTLQDYFMSFYKEERDFGGLEGVKGNSKEGLNKGDSKDGK